METLSRWALLEPRDAEFVYNEYRGHLEHLLAVYLFDAGSEPGVALTDTSVQQWMRDRLGSHHAFTSVITRPPLGIEHPRWVPAEHIDLRDHVSVRAVSQPGWEGLGPLLGEILTSRIDLSRPPWELHVVTGVTSLDMFDGRPLTAVGLKLHHSAADGLAVMDLAHKLFSETPRPVPDRAVIRFPRLRILAESIRAIPRRTRIFVGSIPENRASARAVEAACAAGEWPRLPERPETRFNTATSGRACVHSVSLPGEQISIVKGAAPHLTINDVVLAATGGALDRYLRERGEEYDGSLVAMVPRSMRGIEKWESANQLVALAVDMHTDRRDPIGRLLSISRSARLEKARTSHPAVRRQVAAMDTAPPFFWQVASYMHKRKRYGQNASRAFHTMVSNIPLTVEGLTFDGATAVAVLGSQPPVDGDRLRHFVTTGTDGGLTLTVIADPEAMPDLPHYLELVRASLAELEDAASVATRQPGASEITSRAVRSEHA
ncbi:DUF1298 domain-containing protein [Rhodococcus sp. ABRD24]|nr:DUF1298 domain-containing protein [Rhodococcus sp. ABRD24]